MSPRVVGLRDAVWTVNLTDSVKTTILCITLQRQISHTENNHAPCLPQRPAQQEMQGEYSALPEAAGLHVNLI